MASRFRVTAAQGPALHATTRARAQSPVHVTWQQRWRTRRPHSSSVDQSSLARCVAAGMQDAAQCAEAQLTHAATDVAPDVAEAAAAAAFELPVHPIQPLPVAQAPPAECDEHAAGARSDDDGFEFGSDAASDSSSSWTSSDEETGAPLTSASLPSWLARRTAGGRCALRRLAVLCRHSPRRVA